MTEQLRDLQVRMAASDTPSAGVIAFLRQSKLRILFLSVAAVTPCVWHRRIEAGDLGSHVYNAWLAQLIGKGQAPGLYIAKQWNNVLFDVVLLRAANLVGMAAAEKMFQRALERGKRQGDFPGLRDPRAVARFLYSSLQGLLLMAKATQDGKLLNDVVKVTLSVLD